MEFRILGPLEVWDGERRIDLPRAKQRALLAALLLRPGEVVSVDRLLADLWGEAPPPAAIGSLHNLVSALRKTLGAQRVRTAGHGYALDADRDRIDLHRFTRLVQEAREATGAQARRRLLREALSLWRGAPLADVAFEPFADVEIARLEELHVAAREELVESELVLGRHGAVVGELETLVAEHPYRERPRALLMLALYRAGRQADALAAFAATRRFLRDEVGLEPGPELKKLQAEILRQDPGLDARAASDTLAAGELRRKTVTVLFTDIVGSTELAAELDPEAYRAVLRRYFHAVRDLLERHGGTVEKFIGDAVAAVFGVPRRHEDDALRAVTAAVELRTVVAELNAELSRRHGVTIHLRTGVNTGEVVAGDPDGGQGYATGHAVNVAAKLQQAAPADAVLIGPATYRLVRDAVVAESTPPIHLGRRTLPAFAVAAVTGNADSMRNLGAPLVGRSAELAALRRAFDDVCRERSCRVVTVAGDAGIGKSRLARELAAELAGRARIAVGRCASYGEGSTYLPLAEVVGALAPDESEAALAALLGRGHGARTLARRVRELLGWTDGVTSVADGHAAVRRLLDGAARAQPLVVVLEDVHWAEPPLLDLVEDLAAHRGGAAILVLCLARPDLLETRPRWPIDITLEPLSAQHADELLRNLADGAGIADDLAARIARLAEGNPLYAEQLFAHVRHDGPDALAVVPATVEAVLAARLEQLEERERAVLERAAVVGREFPSDLVAALAGRRVEDELARLSGSGFLRPGGHGRIRFHHVLIRDVAYGAVTKERRTELHERVAEWLATRGGSDEIVGYHLEQAHRCGTALSGVDEHIRALAQDAGERLSAAGLRAFKREDAHAAVNLLERALVLIDDERRRAELLTELGAAYRLRGDGDAAVRTLRSALEAAGSARARPAGARARLELAHAGLYGVGDLRATPADVDECAAGAIPVLEEAGDDRGLARAWLAVADARSFALDVEAWRHAAARARVHYERSGYSPAAALGVQLAALYWGPRPVATAIAESGVLLRERDAEGSLVDGTASVFVAGLEAMRGRFDVARGLVARARRIYDERGATVLAAETWSTVSAEIHRLEGDRAAAADVLRRACDSLAQMKQHAALASAAGSYADVLITLHAPAEAERYVSVSRHHAGAADAASQVLWRTAAARLAIHGGEMGDAETVAREALALVSRSDALSFRAKAMVDAAEVIRLTGSADEAAELVGGALRLYEQKGNTAAAALLAPLRPASTGV